MTDQHQITPPPELVEQWECEYHHMTYGPDLSIFISEKAARWGADQELDACCALLLEQGAWPWPEEATRIRAARRPKPPSLKEQAKFAAAVLRSPDETCSIAELQQHWHTICNALEQLND